VNKSIYVYIKKLSIIYNLRIPARIQTKLTELIC